MWGFLGISTLHETTTNPTDQFSAKPAHGKLPRNKWSPVKVCPPAHAPSPTPVLRWPWIIQPVSFLDLLTMHMTAHTYLLLLYCFFFYKMNPCTYCSVPFFLLRNVQCSSVSKSHLRDDAFPSPLHLIHRRGGSRACFRPHHSPPWLVRHWPAQNVPANLLFLFFHSSACLLIV